MCSIIRKTCSVEEWAKHTSYFRNREVHAHNRQTGAEAWRWRIEANIEDKKALEKRWRKKDLTGVDKKKILIATKINKKT